MSTQAKANTYKMDKDAFFSIFDDSISVKRQNEIKAMISDRFQYIMETLFQLNAVEFSWYDFDNEAGEDNPGHFDPMDYREETDFTGEWNSAPSGFESPELDNCTFPNTWYYEDFEQSVIDELTRQKDEKERKAQERKRRKEQAEKRGAELIASIKAKLTEEEVLYLKHKIKTVKF